MTIKASAFLALEASLTNRLQKSLRKLTTALYKKVGISISGGDFTEAERLVNSLNLSAVMEDNKEYVAYLTDMAMLFGASRVTPNPGTSVVGLGYEKTIAQQAAQSLTTMIVQRGGDHIKNTALQLIALARKDAQVVVEKANPYHDEEGKFSSKENSVRVLHGTSSKVLDKIIREGLLPSTTTGVKIFDQGVLVQGRENAVFATPSEEAASQYAFKAAKKLKGVPAVLELRIPKDAWDKFEKDAHDNNGFFTDKPIPPEWIVGATVFDKKTLEWVKKASGVAVYLPLVLPVESVKKAERRILKPFASFMNETGEAFFDIASSLHTSRVSAYGFTAEALALGYEEYEINEQLDTSTCAVCQAMHGKRFKVSDARSVLDVALRVDNPDDLRSLQPWPSQSKDAVAAMREMTSAELVANRWHIPPFHPRCRGLLGRVGKVPTTQQVVSGTADTGYTATKEDFKALGASFSTEAVAMWNKHSNISPLEFAARLQGTTEEALMLRLLKSKKVGSSGIMGMSGSKNISLRMEYPGFGTSLPFYQNIQIKPSLKALYINAVELDAADQASGMMKQYMRELVSVTRDMGLPAIHLTAGLEVGGYAWAKYGFAPTVESWTKLTATLAKRIAANKLMKGLSKSTVKAVQALLVSKDPASIFVLSDLTEKTHTGVAIGKALLLGTEWSGGLSLDNQVSMGRFLSYIGVTK